MAQCYKDRHNTSWNESWISCQTSQNPNAERGEGHWILYDFGHTYRLGATHIWNVNAPEHLNDGFREFYIDYSQDGKSWKTLGQFALEQADGLSTYEGVDLTSFGGDTARFVLLTAQSNWGGACSGIAEAKFEVIELVREIHTYNSQDCFEVAIFPNPHRDYFNLSVRPKCEGRITYGLYDHTGKLILQEVFETGQTIFQKEIYTNNLSPGFYHLLIQQNESIGRYPVMKIY
jgi:hypothetical protein